MNAVQSIWFESGPKKPPSMKSPEKATQKNITDADKVAMSILPVSVIPI